MATAAAVAASYSPISGLITDNNFRQYAGAPSKVGPVGAYQPYQHSPGLNQGSFIDPYAPPAPGSSGAPAGVPGSITGAGAYTPDWASLISNDAGLKDAQAALSAGGAQNQAQLDAELANAYESFGKNVDLAQLAQSLGMSQADLQNALGPDVQKLAQSNTDAGLSTTSRLDQANQKATQQIIANLNRRGLLHSGEAGYELDQQNTAYRQAQSDAYQKFLGYLQQYQQGYLSAQRQNAQSLAGAYSSAADRVYNNNQGSAGVTAIFDHIDANGNAVYRDGNGNLFNPDGSRYTPSAPPPPSTSVQQPNLSGFAPRNGIGVI